jgi:hypothetical protein
MSWRKKVALYRWWIFRKQRTGEYLRDLASHTSGKTIQQLNLTSFNLIFLKTIPFTIEIRFGNELMEVLNGFENTRYARASLSMEAMKKYMLLYYDTAQIINLNLDISIKKLPMNWLLSHTAMNRVNDYTDSLMLLKKDSIEVQKLFNAIKKIKN